MTESFVFRMPASKEKYNFVHDMGLDLKKILSNSRTVIYQSNEMRLSIDEKVVRVMLFDKNNDALLEKIREFFYGEKYAQL